MIVVATIHQIKTTTMASTIDPKEYQNIFHWAETQKDGSIPSFSTRRNDPYQVLLPPFNSHPEYYANYT